MGLGVLPSEENSRCKGLAADWPWPCEMREGSRGGGVLTGLGSRDLPRGAVFVQVLECCVRLAPSCVTSSLTVSSHQGDNPSHSVQGGKTFLQPGRIVLDLPCVQLFPMQQLSDSPPFCTALHPGSYTCGILHLVCNSSPFYSLKKTTTSGNS